METILFLVVAGLALLVGMAIGIGIQEAGTRQRERRIAAQRRELAEQQVLRWREPTA